MVFFIKILSYDLITGQGIANLTARADLPAGIYGVSLVPDGDILRNNNININIKELPIEGLSHSQDTKNAEHVHNKLQITAYVKNDKKQKI